MSEIVLQQPPPAPPRIARNRSALAKYLADNGIASQWPSVEQQLPVIEIKGLKPGGYNPCIFRHRGQLLLAYRFHPTPALSTKLSLAELDEQFNVISDQVLDLNDENSNEDSRLFERNGNLYMLYVSSTWPTFPAAQVKCVMLEKPDHWRASGAFEYWLPDRQTIEKNHLAIQKDDVLHIAYHHNLMIDGVLTQRICTPADERKMESPALHWPFGTIRGGTNPIPYKGGLLTFFHSSMFNEEPPDNFRYYMGAAVLEAEMPFKMTAVSRRPIIRACETGGDKSRNHWKTKVVFPMGCIEHNDGWLVSAGLNDSACVLIQVSEKDLQL